MGSLCLPSALREGILSHARATAPRECCGVLVGRSDGERIRVESVRRGRNVASEPARRYSIDLETLLSAHREARSEAREVVGYYHSHPGSPAVPSAHDRDHAWDGARHLIVGRRGEALEIRCWLFESEPREEVIRPC